MARAIPVLPEVASIRVSPGLICPRSSARVIIDSAGRSLTEPAGLFPSSLSNRVLLVSPAMRCKRTRGVLPTQSAIVGYCKVMAYSQSRLRGEHHTGKAWRAISRKVRCLWLKGISTQSAGHEAGPLLARQLLNQLLLVVRPQGLHLTHQQQVRAFAHLRAFDLRLRTLHFSIVLPKARVEPRSVFTRQKLPPAFCLHQSSRP